MLHVVGQTTGGNVRVKRGITGQAWVTRPQSQCGVGAVGATQRGVGCVGNQRVTWSNGSQRPTTGTLNGNHNNHNNGVGVTTGINCITGGNAVSGGWVNKSVVIVAMGTGHRIYQRQRHQRRNNVR